MKTIIVVFATLCFVPMSSPAENTLGLANAYDFLVKEYFHESQWEYPGDDRTNWNLYLDSELDEGACSIVVHTLQPTDRGATDKSSYDFWVSFNFAEITEVTSMNTAFTSVLSLRGKFRVAHLTTKPSGVTPDRTYGQESLIRLRIPAAPSAGRERIIGGHIMKFFFEQAIESCRTRS